MRYAQCWKAGEDRVSNEEQSDGKDMRLGSGDGAASDGTMATALNLTIKLLVEVVIPGAGGATEKHVEGHHDSGESQQLGRVRGLGPDAGGVEYADDVREIESVEATRAVETHELGVGNP